MIFTMGTPLWRMNIVNWADRNYSSLPDIIDSLFECDTATSVGKLYNISALIEKFLGRKNNAQELCHRQMRLHEHMISREQNLDRLEGLVQSWVNIERLLLRAGQGRNVRENFDRLWNYQNIDSLIFGNTAIKKSTWQLFMNEERFYKWIGSFYFEDTAKSFIHDKKYVEAFTFSLRFLQTEFGKFNVEAAETCLVSLQCSNKLESALRYSIQFLEQFQENGTLLFKYHQAKILFDLGDISKATEIIIQIAVQLSSYIINEKITSVGLSLLLSVATLSRHLHQNDLAGHLAHLAFEAARQVEDEVFLIEATTLRAECSSGDERRHWENLAQEQRRETAYAHLALDRGARYRETNPIGRPHEGRLFAELSDALASLV
jgi:tetratricopeptide (TPR) repeat protein